MSAKSSLRVTSDVRRDLLASASAFKNEASVVWEYVVNGLQYVERGVAPRIQVTVKPRAMIIEVADNGSGMNSSELEHFFRMHGENRDRQQGRTGRGKFGTGKSAAFGIARALRIDSRQDGIRNVVELDRKTIDSSSGDDIPLNWKTRNETTPEGNGTIITISEIVLQRLNSSSIIEYIERHLQAFRGANPQVAVNDHLCEYREPAVAEEFRFAPSAEQQETLGVVELVIKVGQAPLPEVDQGIAITAGVGNLVAIEKAGLERKEFGSYLFGTIDVPRLETFSSVIEPYDSSRSLSLNPVHPVAMVLIPFIGAKLEEVRGKLIGRERDARKSEQARQLAKEANLIAEILNRDFEGVRQRLQDIRSAASTTGTAPSAFGDSQAAGDTEEEWVKGTLAPGRLAQQDKTPEKAQKNGRDAPTITTSGTPDQEGPDSLDRAGGNEGRRSKPKGGFKVGYRNMGRDESRSVYDPNGLQILINLDHPVVSAAAGESGVAEVGFRRLSYEIAFSEYSLALGYEMAKQDPDMPPDDLLYEVRSSLNRISLAAASLYR
jgi:hypothetical protein